MIPYRISLICVLLPLICVHTTLIIAVSVGNLEFCIPYWSECHSISATGRQYPEFFVFKALIIPTAVFMGLYWLLLHKWVNEISAGKYSPLLVTIMGLVAACALVVYSVTLGAQGEGYAIARRLGIVFYFAFTSFAHLVLLRYLDKLDTDDLGIVKEQNQLIIASTVLIGTAIASAVAGLLVDELWDKWENAYEWWFSLVMISMFYRVGEMWRKTNFQLALSVIDKASS